MSTQETAALIASVNQMTATVAGKMGQIDQRVESAKQDFNKFIESADERYKTQTPTQIKVGGQWNKYYPVRIFLRGGPVNKLNIYRPDLYENRGQIDGLSPEHPPATFTASILTIGDAYGHRVPFYAFDSYHYHSYKFIGKVVNHYKSQSIWVWLRGGGVNYYLTHDSIFIKPELIQTHNAVTDSQGDLISIYLGGFSSAQFGISFLPIMDSEIDPSLPESGYIRGVS
jgi:hypothetical protein